MATESKNIPKAQQKGESKELPDQEAVPFDDALRRLVNTPPKPVKKPDKGKRPARAK